MKGLIILPLALSLAACGHVTQSNTNYVVTSGNSCCSTTTKYVTKTCCPTVVKKPVKHCCVKPVVMSNGCCGSGGAYYDSYYQPAVYTDSYVGSVYSDYDYYYY